MTLLIVDDEARIRDLIRKYAAFEGYNVEEASNGMKPSKSAGRRTTTSSSWM